MVWVSFSGLSSRDFYDICHCTYLSAIRQLNALEVPVIDDLKTATWGGIGYYRTLTLEIKRRRRVRRVPLASIDINRLLGLNCVNERE